MGSKTLILFFFIKFWLSSWFSQNLYHQDNCILPSLCLDVYQYGSCTIACIGRDGSGTELCKRQGIKLKCHLLHHNPHLHLTIHHKIYLASCFKIISCLLLTENGLMKFIFAFYGSNANKEFNICAPANKLYGLLSKVIWKHLD